jgi:hypothetical protein
MPTTMVYGYNFAFTCSYLALHISEHKYTHIRERERDHFLQHYEEQQSLNLLSYSDQLHGQEDIWQ